MDILQLTAHVKYIEFVLDKLSSESNEYSIRDLKKSFEKKYGTVMPPLNNQYFGIMRLLPLLCIREAVKRSDGLSEDIIIIGAGLDNAERLFRSYGYGSS